MRNVGWDIYAPIVAAPFPVDPADVPPDAVRAVRRTLLRQASEDVDDDELARLVVAVVIAALHQDMAAKSPQ
jgi:hypothetical protein